MAKRKEKKLTPARPQLGDNVEILSAGEVLESAITDTLETNYMPYAMSVIVSRALPEIDGFKPAHRKLLYTMYEMGLLKGNRTKSANIVGSTMHLNPDGADAAACHLPDDSGQQHAGHCRRHGIQHLFLQPRGTLQCDDCPDEGPAGRFAGNHSGP